MKRLLAWMAVGVTVGLLLPRPATAEPARFRQWLQGMEWKARVLLVFAPSEEDPRLRKQRSALNWDQASLNERELMVVQITADGVARVNGQPTTAFTVADAFAAGEVAPGDFAVLLIGKDGEEKERWNQPTTLEDICDSVDAMPMRGAERRQAR